MDRAACWPCGSPARRCGSSACAETEIADQARLFHVLSDASLDPAWPAYGLPLGSYEGAPAGALTPHLLARDGAGGLLAAWPAPPTLFGKLALRRVLESGAAD